MPVHGENYFLVPDPANIFMSAFNVSGFPSYMIIDKSGKIVTLNGPRPSQPEEIKKNGGRIIIKLFFPCIYCKHIVVNTYCIVC